MAVNITPLHDRVVVKRFEEKESIKGGIIIPDSAKEKPQEGEVVAVGAGKREKGERIPLDVKVGDRVLFGKYSGNDIKIDDEEYMILKEDEILAKLVLPRKRPAARSKVLEFLVRFPNHRPARQQPAGITIAPIQRGERRSWQSKS